MGYFDRSGIQELIKSARKEMDELEELMEMAGIGPEGSLKLNSMENDFLRRFNYFQKQFPHPFYIFIILKNYKQYEPFELSSSKR